MDHIIAFTITVFTGFFAISNPIANLPVNMSLLQGVDKETRKRINQRSTFTAFMIVAIFTILGQIIFKLFGLTIPAFKITGGILIFIIGFDMLHSKGTTRTKDLGEVHVDEDIAISPLATPLIAGPGSIATAMSFVSDQNWLYMGIVILMYGLVCFMHYVAFSMGDIIIRRIGYNIIAVIGKIMGLIIAVIGTGMVIQGIEIVFTGDYF